LISGCLISYNEQQCIRRALENLTRFTDEIILLDSFSTDQTRAIASEYGCKIYQHPIDNFRDQRNRAIEKCSGDWIFVMDCDEYCDNVLANSVKRLAHEATDTDCFIFPTLNLIDGNEFSVTFKTRLFRNYVRYGGSGLHEGADVGVQQAVTIHDCGRVIHDKSYQQQVRSNRICYILRPDLYSRPPDGAEDLQGFDHPVSPDSISIYEKIIQCSVLKA
jgi:glycosyltransferase involved in cell wall biosynthesis